MPRASLVVAVLLSSAMARAQTVIFDSPEDDRWSYPFNFQSGNEVQASLFGATSPAGIGTPFNDRDAMIVAAWDTSTLIPEGMGPDQYHIHRITIRFRNIPLAEWLPDTTTDPWYTFDVNMDGLVNADGIPRDEPGDSDGESDDADAGRPIELFGVGYGPVYSESGWTEHSLYEGPTCAAPPNIDCLDEARDPFPITYRTEAGTTDVVHVEDSVKGLHNEQLTPPIERFSPQAWAVGVAQDYVPGSQALAFDVEFEIDLCEANDTVRSYFKQQLDNGRLAVMVTSLVETSIGGSASGFPKFYTKEAVGQPAFPDAAAGRLTIELGLPLNDCDSDGLPDVCDLASGDGDCNANTIPDDCDIDSGFSLDEDGNGIPDECGCATVSTCCDLDNNGVRDDACLWCACESETCNIVDLAPAFADMGGPFGACTPDGFANIHDRTHALTCFAGSNPCNALNIDAGGPFGSCAPDGFCNIHDANHALNAFAGTQTCTCPSGPAPTGGSPSGNARIELRSAHTVVRPGSRFEVEVWITQLNAPLSGYQLELSLRGGRAGHLSAVGARIDSHSHSIFANAQHFRAFNVDAGRVLCGLESGEEPIAMQSGYLATFEMQVSADAQGQFVVDLTHNVALSQTDLIGVDNTQIRIDAVEPVVIHVNDSSNRRKP
jgi:hypothetical protein